MEQNNMLYDKKTCSNEIKKNVLIKICIFKKSSKSCFCHYNGSSCHSNTTSPCSLIKRLKIPFAWSEQPSSSPMVIHSSAIGHQAGSVQKYNEHFRYNTFDVYILFILKNASMRWIYDYW